MSYLARVAFGLLALCVMLSAPRAADAAVKTASIGVSATVVDTCSISVSGADVRGSAQCAQATPYRLVTSIAPADVVSTLKDIDSTRSSSSQVKPQTASARVMVMTFVF